MKHKQSLPFGFSQRGKIENIEIFLIFCCTFTATFKPQANATHVLHISARLATASAPERRAGAVR